jgi:excisionase family DNA binding protein
MAKRVESEARLVELVDRRLRELLPDVGEQVRELLAEIVAVRPATVAVLLDVSTGTVRSWLRSGRLPSVQVGRAVLVRVRDLRLLLERGEW